MSPLVSCSEGATKSDYVVVGGIGGGRTLQLLRGAVRCEDGVFRLVEGQRPTCDLSAPEAPADAPVFADAFFRDVASEWQRAGIALRGIGLLRCKRDTPRISLGDYALADRATTILIERARAWQLAGPIYLSVTGVPGVCLE